METKKAKFLREKFKKLKEEHYSNPQRTAIALSYARKNGYDVGPKPEGKRI